MTLQEIVIRRQSMLDALNEGKAKICQILEEYLRRDFVKHVASPLSEEDRLAPFHKLQQLQNFAIILLTPLQLDPSLKS